MSRALRSILTALVVMAAMTGIAAVKLTGWTTNSDPVIARTALGIGTNGLVTETLAVTGVSPALFNSALPAEDPGWTLLVYGSGFYATNSPQLYYTNTGPDGDFLGIAQASTEVLSSTVIRAMIYSAGDSGPPWQGHDGVYSLWYYDSTLAAGTYLVLPSCLTFSALSNQPTAAQITAQIEGPLTNGAHIVVEGTAPNYVRVAGPVYADEFHVGSNSMVIAYDSPNKLATFTQDGNATMVIDGNVNGGTALGTLAQGTNAGVAIGMAANGIESGVGVGANANGHNNGVAVGNAATGPHYGTAVGDTAAAGTYAVGLGHHAGAGPDYSISIGALSDVDSANGLAGIAIGPFSVAQGNYSVAIGTTNDASPASAQAIATGAFELGTGQATEPWALHYRGVPIVDSNGVHIGSAAGSSSLPVGGIAASGTPDATTVLYGNGTWAAPSAAAATNVMMSAAGTGISITTNGLLYTVADAYAKQIGSLNLSNWAALATNVLGDVIGQPQTNISYTAVTNAPWVTTNYSSVVSLTNMANRFSGDGGGLTNLSGCSAPVRWNTDRRSCEHVGNDHSTASV